MAHLDPEFPKPGILELKALAGGFLDDLQFVLKYQDLVPSFSKLSIVFYVVLTIPTTTPNSCKVPSGQSHVHVTPLCKWGGPILPKGTCRDSADYYRL